MWICTPECYIDQLTSQHWSERLTMALWTSYFLGTVAQYKAWPGKACSCFINLNVNWVDACLSCMDNFLLFLFSSIRIENWELRNFEPWNFRLEKDHRDQLVKFIEKKKNPKRMNGAETLESLHKVEIILRHFHITLRRLHLAYILFPAFSIQK